ncbi:MAG TPA: DUF937 domain-containing protein [Rhabdaerophilum sp.]|nr:DUF937 domain-containing protein [Rhabdaerophilum sp.]
MINLFEIMQAAQGGNAFNNLGQQFGIGSEQAQKAVEAVLPAISLGLQQQTQTIEGWQNILNTLSQSQGSAAFFDSDGDGIPDHLENESNGALGTMFGGPEMAQAVANNAAQFAGLPASIMQQMLPVIASMIIGGLFKGASNSGLGGILGQMMQGGTGAGGLGGMLGGMFGQPSQPQNPMGNVFGNILGQMMGGGAPQPQQNPMGGMFGNILGQMMGGARPAPQQTPDPMSAGLDMLKGMFETGREVQASQMDAWQKILGQLGQRT